MHANTTCSPERRVWHNLLEELSERDPAWRERAGLLEIDPASRPTEGFGRISNTEAFEAFAVALLSGNTRWDRIERVRSHLREPFRDFAPEDFAALTEAQIERDVLPWFRERRAGSAGLRGGLLRLRQTAAILAGAGRFGSADELIRAGMKEAGGSAERLALLFGSQKDWKLPGFGVALAAEALRLLHFDLCKPDRHVLRALSSWKLVPFARWDRKGQYTAPDARPGELLAAMLEVRAIAEASGVTVTYTNSVIWFAGAVSGARLTNEDLEALRND